MQTKKEISFEIEKEDRVYRLQLPENAPLGEAYEATACFLNKFAELIKEHSEAVQPMNDEEKDSEEEKSSEEE